MFGEDLIGCLFIKNAWVMRETALRHLSREIIMLLSHPTEQDVALSVTDQSQTCDNSNIQSGDRSRYQSRIEYILEISCQILAMMMMDPVYKVYVASLVKYIITILLCYCWLIFV